MGQLLTRIPPRYRRPELLTGLVVLFLLVASELAVISGLVNRVLLMPPTQVFGKLVSSMGSKPLRVDILATAVRVLVTFVICILISAPLSVLFWKYDTLREAFIPMFGAIFGTPIVLGYLVLVAIFGRGDITIILISTHALIPMVINGTDALASVDEVYVDVARSFNAGRLQTMLKVILPAAAPDIFAGIRIGFSYIMISVTAVEFLLTVHQGLGGRISNKYLRFRTTEMYVAIVFIILLVILSIFILRQIEGGIRR